MDLGILIMLSIDFIILIIFIMSLIIKNQINCEHKNKFIYVVSASHTCETTTVNCLDCKKQLTKPKTDCR